MPARPFTSVSEATRPGFDLAQFDVEGQSTTIGLELEYPLIRSRNENLDLRFRFDSLHQVNTNALLTNTQDDLRSLRIGATYQNVNNYVLNTAAVDTFDFEFSHGLDAFASSKDDDANLTRPGAEPDYFKINGEYQRLQRLSSKFNLLMGAKAQWTSQELLASEEFGVGGLDYGRGYDASEIIGDRGYAAKFELQLNDPFVVPDVDIDSFQLYSFYDWGTIWDADATAASERRNSVTSTGLGTRVDFTPEIAGDLYVAFPLTRDVQTERDNGPRIFAGIERRF